MDSGQTLDRYGRIHDICTMWISDGAMLIIINNQCLSTVELQHNCENIRITSWCQRPHCITFLLIDILDFSEIVYRVQKRTCIMSRAPKEKKTRERKERGKNWWELKKKPPKRHKTRANCSHWCEGERRRSWSKSKLLHDPISSSILSIVRVTAACTQFAVTRCNNTDVKSPHPHPTHSHSHSPRNIHYEQAATVHRVHRDKAENSGVAVHKFASFPIFRFVRTMSKMNDVYRYYRCSATCMHWHERI